MCLAVPSMQVDDGYIKGLNVVFGFAKGKMEERARWRHCCESPKCPKKESRQQKDKQTDSVAYIPLTHIISLLFFAHFTRSLPPSLPLGGHQRNIPFFTHSRPPPGLVIEGREDQSLVSGFYIGVEDGLSRAFQLTCLLREGREGRREERKKKEE